MSAVIQKLKSEIENDPASIGYWSGGIVRPAKDVRTLLRTVNRVVYSQVSRDALRAWFDAQDTINLLPFWEDIRQYLNVSASDPANGTLSVVCRFAFDIRDAPDYPDIDLQSVRFQTLVTVFVTSNILTAAQTTELFDLGKRIVSRAVEIGVSDRLDDISEACLLITGV